MKGGENYFPVFLLLSLILILLFLPLSSMENGRVNVLRYAYNIQQINSSDDESTIMHAMLRILLRS